MAKICFTPKDFKGGAAELIEKANELLESEYEGIRITLRQLWYRFIGLDLIPYSWVDDEYNKAQKLPLGTKNTARNYKRLGKLISDARLAGLIDWESIEDRGRRPTVWRDAENIKAAVEDAIRRFRLPRWKGQKTYCELWCEKDALASFLEPIAMEYHLPIQINKGYSSSSAMFDSAERLFEAATQFAEWLSRDPSEEVEVVPIVVLYVGDHDPSGEDMVRDLQARLNLFMSEHLVEVEVEVRKVCLTMEQVRQYKLIPNPARPPPPKGGGSKKGTDSRSAGYTAEHGNESWEVDALEPRVLQRLVRTAIEEILDMPKMERMKEREDAQRMGVEKAIDKVLRQLKDDEGDDDE